MYDENEILVTTENIGSKEKNTFIKKGTEVTFVKAVDGEDLKSSLVAFKYDGKVRVTLESNIMIKDKRKSTKAFHEMSEGLYKKYPRTRRYHYNYVKRMWYRVFYFFVDLFGGKSE